MLRVRDGYQELAAYLTGCLIAEDAIWSTLAATGHALTSEELAAALTETWPVPACFEHKRLSFILKQSRRFNREDRHSWSLAVWYLPFHRPYLSKAEFILDSAGRPLSADDMNRLIARCHPVRVDFSRMGISYPRMFVCANSLWLLRHWLTGPDGDAGKVDLFDQMVEPCDDTLADASVALADLVASLLARLRIPLSGYHLSWTLKRIGTRFTDTQLAEALTGHEQIAAVGAHWTIRGLLTLTLQEFADMSLHQWEACQRRLRTIWEQASWERELQSEARDLAHRAKGVLERNPMSLDDLITNELGVALVLRRAPSETEWIRAFSVARSELSNSLLSNADVVRLADGTLVVLSESKIGGIVKRICEELRPMRTADILEELCPNDYRARRELLDALEKRLQKYSTIENTDGFWHPTTGNLRRRITEQALGLVLQTTLESGRPVPLRELACQLFAIGAIPPDPLGQLLLEETRAKLRGLKQLWELKGDLWWAQPWSLATTARLEMAAAAYDPQTDTLDERALCALSDLDLGAVSAPDLAAINSAFIEAFRHIQSHRDGAPAASDRPCRGTPDAQEARLSVQEAAAQAPAMTQELVGPPRGYLAAL